VVCGCTCCYGTACCTPT